MSSTEKEETQSGGFSLASASASFSSKSSDIFGSLEVLERKHSAFQKTQASSESLEQDGIIKQDPIEDSGDFGRNDGKRSNSNWRENHPFSHRSRHSRDRDFRDRDRPPARSHDFNRRGGHRNDNRHNFNQADKFRRPRLPPQKAKHVPDFKKHPEKWTSYSLEDVSESDLSDKSNTRAALEFLWDRKNERERQERLALGLPAEEEKFETETAACSKGLISFSRKKRKEVTAMETDAASNITRSSHKSQGGIFGEPLDENDYDEDGGSVESVTSSRLSQIEMPISSTDNDNDKISSKNLTVSDSVAGGDGEKSDNKPVPTFKSRKNFRKQIRRRDNDEALEENDD